MSLNGIKPTVHGGLIHWRSQQQHILHSYVVYLSIFELSYRFEQPAICLNLLRP